MHTLGFLLLKFFYGFYLCAFTGLGMEGRVRSGSVSTLRTVCLSFLLFFGLHLKSELICRDVREGNLIQVHYTLDENGIIKPII